MFYEGNSLEELCELLLTVDEPVAIRQSFLTAEDLGDLSIFHGWVFQPVWYDTEILMWSPGSVSSRTTKYQRFLPPGGLILGDSGPEPESDLSDIP